VIDAGPTRQAALLCSADMTGCKQFVASGSITANQPGPCSHPHQQLCPGFTPELAPEPWYGAESALVVTALSHTQVSSVAGCEAVTVPLRPEGHSGRTNLGGRGRGEAGHTGQGRSACLHGNTDGRRGFVSGCCCISL
jgi:hypothetical protein